MKRKIFILILLFMILFSISTFALTSDININPGNKTISVQGKENAIVFELENTYILQNSFSFLITRIKSAYRIDFYDDKGKLINYLTSASGYDGATVEHKVNVAPGQRIKRFEIYATGTVATPYVPIVSVRLLYSSIELPREEFKLISKNADTKQNQYKFVFNYNFNINASDIEFTDSKGNAVNFTYTKNGQELIISSTDDLKVGSYKINLKKVTSTDSETLLNIPLTFSVVNNFYLVSKSFGDKIPSDTKELYLTFNKNFTITTLSVGNLTIDYTINGNNLKILLPTLSDETDYPTYIKLKSIESEILELNINLSTRSITGNKTLDKILYEILRLFEEAKRKGTPLFKYAIEFGTIFIVALWLWNLLKSWLKSI